MTRRIPDLLLERYRLKELPEHAMRAIEHMLAADPALRARLEALDASDADIRSRYAPLIHLHDKPASQRRFVFRLASAAVVAAMALLVVVALPRSASQSPDADRIKGDVAARPALALYRRTASGSERLADGDIARPGDLLRVGYASAGRPYGVILSIDGGGGVTMHLPPSGDRAAALTPGKMILLDSAYELDEAPRVERFYFVTGATPFQAAPILAAARRLAAERKGAVPDALPLPEGLEQVTFAIQKEARK
jgi:hypothetical protein